MSLDKNLLTIIDEIAKEDDLQPETVEKVIRTMCDWTRQQFVQLNHTAVMWPMFGSFDLIRKKLKDLPTELEVYDKYHSKRSKKYKGYLEYLKKNKTKTTNHGNETQTD